MGASKSFLCSYQYYYDSPHTIISQSILIQLSLTIFFINDATRPRKQQNLRLFHFHINWKFLGYKYNERLSSKTKYWIIHTKY